MLDIIQRDKPPKSKLIRHKGDCGRLDSNEPIDVLANDIMTLADWSRDCISKGGAAQADAALRAIWRYAAAIKSHSTR